MNEHPPARPLAVAAFVVGSYVAISLLLIGAGLLVLHLGAHTVAAWDDDVMTWTVRQRTAWMDAATADITHVANTAGIVVVAAFVTALVTFRRRTRWALLLLLALPIELAGFLTVNYAVGRPRPHVLHLGSTPSTFSWPSGHVAATVVLYGGLAILAHVRSHSRTLVISTSGLAALLTIAIAVSRVYRGEHHPTDVFAGLFLGIGALATAVVALQLGAGPSVSPRLTQGQQMARVS